MKNGVFAFALVLSASCGFAGLVGCSSSDDAPVTETDAGSDAVVDSTPVTDTAVVVDTAPTTCVAALPSGFACVAPEAKAGSTACTDKMLTEFLNCFGSGDTTKCTAAQKAYPMCNTCVLSTWIVENPSGGGSIDVGACIQKVDPTSTCGKSVQCDTDCYNTMCETCDTTAGSGSTASRSEFDDCYRDVRFKGSSAKAKGACYDVATKDATTCLNDAKYANCVITSIDSVKNFYRGACRDNGVWTNADKPDGTETAGDAGTDSGSDAATDAGGDTAVPTETGTDAAADALVDVAVDVATDGG